MTSSPNLTPNHIAHTLLTQAHSPATASAIFTTKVLHKPLHLRPTSPDPTSQDARSHRRLLRLRKKEHIARRQKPKPLSAKEKRILGIYDIPPAAQKYEIFVPLHNLWVGYMWEILGLKDGNGEGKRGYVTAQGAGSKLASADFHGAEVEVVRSGCVGRVGTRGIVVKDTKFTFEVVTRANVLRTVPKKGTVFRFEIPQPEGDIDVTGDGQGDGETGESMGERRKAETLVFELYGSQFETRAPDRATKKFKQKNMTDL